MARFDWYAARRPQQVESIFGPDYDLLAYAILGFCRQEPCKGGRYIVPIAKVVSILAAGAMVKAKRRRGRRGEEWADAHDETREAILAQRLRELCPFDVTYNEADGYLVKPEVWLRGRGVGDPQALRRIKVQAVSNHLELLPVEVPVK
ncbi:hypothetical protein [Chondromyces apiculatus]|uniref:Uncharacterized protein n=1 Tax=Chondromyces apiculatus DSM 436 TaxID=1192034 RepID=A0A017T3W1_9BACT|nr:hypothetical protein [Chondromyces apiculatus]EYF03251.1 Hypothetical protein CAP_5755 [Chondromyces apiculatus DSM 436]